MSFRREVRSGGRAATTEGKIDEHDPKTPARFAFESRPLPQARIVVWPARISDYELRRLRRRYRHRLEGFYRSRNAGGLGRESRGVNRILGIRPKSDRL